MLWLLFATSLSLTSLANAFGDGDFASSKQGFLERFGNDYGYGGRIDELWAKEVGPRLPSDEHYLDYTGSSLYWNSQVAAALKELESAAFGNPHSTNPSSLRTERLVEDLRRRVLRFLGADPQQYDVVWTRSGTGALRELGETFPWSSASRFAYLVPNHNSVLGIREHARAAGASFGAVEEEEVEAWLRAAAGGGEDDAADAALPPILRGSEGSGGGGGGSGESGTHGRSAGAQPHSRRQLLAQRPEQASLRGLGDAGSDGGTAGGASVAAGASEPEYSLFAFPAYDNFAGVMYPLRWVRAVQGLSTARHRWKVLLDAAAFLPAHPLNLTDTPADHVCISFYKLFGYSTGVGAWVARKEDIAAARKVYWGGGSVFLATSRLDWKHYRPQGPERFEDGTLPFLNIMSLHQGLQVYEALGGQAAIERHTSAIRAWLYEQLAALRHGNGAPLLHIFGRHHRPDSREVQGSTFNFQILKPNGEVFSYRRAATALAEAGFHMRCGCTCNPGSCYASLGIRDEEVAAAAEQAHGNFSDWEWVWVRRKGKVTVPTGGTAPDPEAGPEGGSRLVRLPLGSLRASFGYMSRFEDAHALLSFLKKHYTDRTADDPPAAAAAAAQGRGRRLRWAAPEQQGPGWC